VAPAVHILCALTSITCAFLLLRGYGQSRARLLLWSGLCFIFLAINNLLIFVDEFVIPGRDLSLVRVSTGVIGVALLLYGLIWEAE
jgi:hypothetical protein